MSDWVFMKEELEHTPSQRDGISEAHENTYRKDGCTFIMKLGQKLNLPIQTIITAKVFFHRFFTRHSFRFRETDNHRHDVGMACLFLACKSEDNPQKLSHVLREGCKLRKIPLPDPTSKEYQRLRNKICTNELEVLAVNGFAMEIDQPHATLAEMVLRIPNISEEQREKLVEVASNFINDSYHTTVCLRFKSRDIVAGAVHLAAKLTKLDAPRADPARWMSTVLRSNITDIEETVSHILDFYDKPKRSATPEQPPPPPPPPPPSSAIPPPPPDSPPPPPPPDSPTYSDPSPRKRTFSQL